MKAIFLSLALTGIAAASALADNAPDASIQQNSNFNLAIVMMQMDGSSNVAVSQAGQQNILMSYQGVVPADTFVLHCSPPQCGTSTLYAYQYGQNNMASHTQMSPINVAATVQNATRVGGNEPQYHDTHYVHEKFGDDGFHLKFASGEVEIEAFYNVSGYTSHSTFGRSH